MSTRAKHCSTDKGDKQRYAFFGPKTARALTPYMAICEKRSFRSNAVLVNRDGTPMNRRHAHQTIARFGRRANVSEKRCIPNTLRHTSALFFLRRGGDALSLQRLLGHTTLAMTNRYVSSATVDDPTGAVVEQLPHRDAARDRFRPPVADWANRRAPVHRGALSASRPVALIAVKNTHGDDLCQIFRQCVQFCLALAPVVARRPIGRKSLKHL